MNRPTDPQQLAVDRPLGSLGFLMEKDRTARRGFRIGIVTAVAAHAMIFAVHWPTVAGSAGEPELDRNRLYVVRHYRYIQPERPATRPIAPRTRRVPIPDPTPFDPEPARVPSSEEIDLPIPEDLVVGEVAIPEPPPEQPEIVIVGGDIEAPTLIHRVLPIYTEAARRARIQGAVILELIIDRTGRPEEITVLHGLPFGLTESAVDAVTQWRFEASTLNGRPVAVQYVLTVRFHLE
jgi:TonB family protein